MRSVISAQADIVEPVVIEPGETLRAFLVLPDPFAESVPDLLLRLARGNGFLLVHHAGVLVDLVVNGGRAAVQRIVDQVGGKRPRRSPGRGVADVGFGAVVEGERPGGYGAGMADGDAALGRVEQLRHEFPHVASRNPGGTEAGADVAGQEIDGLNLLQGLDIAAVGRIEAGGGFGGPELRAHIAAQIAVGGLPFALGVAVDQAVQLALQLPGAMPRELLHKRPVNSCRSRSGK